MTTNGEDKNHWQKTQEEGFKYIPNEEYEQKLRQRQLQKIKKLIRQHDFNLEAIERDSKQKDSSEFGIVAKYGRAIQKT